MATNAPKTIDLDEEVPRTLDIETDEGTEAEQPNLPGATPRLREAVAHGAAAGRPELKLSKVEAETPKIPEWYGFTPSNVLGNIYEGAKGLAKSTYGAGKDILLGEGKNEKGEEVHGLGGIVGMNAKGEFAPVERANWLTQKYITDPAVAEANKAEEEARQGHILGAIGHGLAAAVPVFGPWAASLGEQAGTGDIGGAAGQVAGQVGLGEIAAHPVETVKAPLRLADKIVRGTPLTEEGRLEAAKQQAMTVKKPSATEVEYSQKVENALPDLQRIAKDNQGKIKTPREAVRAINNRISQMEAPISEHLKTLKGEQIHPDEFHPAISQAIDEDFARHPGQMSPEEMDKAKEKVLKFIGEKPKTYEELEGNRRRLNSDAESYFSARPADKRVMDASDANAIAQRAAGNAIRRLEYGDDANPGLLERAGVKAVDQEGNPVSMRDFRKRVGNLIDVRDHFEDAITRAEATGDWKAFDKWRSGPSLAAGGLGLAAGAALGGGVGSVLGILAGEGAKAWIDYLKSKNPNLNVQKMFRNLEATGEPNVAQIKLRTPVRQYPEAIGPRMPQYREPIGPEQGIGTIGGEQMPLNLAPESAPLFNLQVGGERPPAMAEKGVLGSIGGPGREGLLSRVETEKPKQAVPAVVQPLKVKLPHPEASELKPNESTYDKFFDHETGKWSPEREANHQAVVDAALAGKTPPKGRPPEAIITMGGTGAGKTTLTRHVIGAEPNFVNIDSDANKLFVPEYEGLKKSDPQKAAFRVHDESTAISKQILKAAVGKGLDFIYDTSTGGGGESLFKRLKENGYRVKLLYADVPVEEAIRRAQERAKNSPDPTNRGRHVPEGIIREKHREAAQAFLKYQNSPTIDSIEAYSTTSKTPTRFYQRVGKESPNVEDARALEAVREKAGEHGPER